MKRLMTIEEARIVRAMYPVFSENETRPFYIDDQAPADSFVHGGQEFVFSEDVLREVAEYRAQGEVVEPVTEVITGYFGPLPEFDEANPQEVRECQPMSNAR